MYVVSREIGDVGTGKYQFTKQPNEIYFQDGKARKIKTMTSGNFFSMVLTENNELWGYGWNGLKHITKDDRFGYHRLTRVTRAPRNVTLFSIYRTEIAAVDGDTNQIVIWNSFRRMVIPFSRDVHKKFFQNTDGKNFAIKELTLCENRLLILYCDENRCRIFYYAVLMEDIESIRESIREFIGPEEFNFVQVPKKVKRILATDSTTLILDDDNRMQLVLYPTFMFIKEERIVSFAAGDENSYIHRLDEKGNPQLTIVSDKTLGKDGQKPETLPLSGRIKSMDCNSHGIVILHVNGTKHVEVFGRNFYSFFKESDEKIISFQNRSKFFLDLDQDDEVKSVSAGKHHFFVLTEKNRMYSFGLNVSGLIGTEPSLPPKQIWNPRFPFEMKFENFDLKTNVIKKIVGNDQTTVILMNDTRTVFAIGANHHNQLCSERYDLQTQRIDSFLRQKASPSESAVPSEDVVINDISMGDGFLSFVLNNKIYTCGKHELNFESDRKFTDISCGSDHCVGITLKSEAYPFISNLRLTTLAKRVKELSSIETRTLILTKNNQLAYMSSVSRSANERKGSLYLLIPPDLSKGEHFKTIYAGVPNSLILTSHGRVFQVAFRDRMTVMKPVQVVVSKPGREIEDISASINLAMILYKAEKGVNRIQVMDDTAPSLYQDDESDRLSLVLNESPRPALLKGLFELLGGRSVVRRTLEFSYFPHNSMNYVIDGKCIDIFTSGNRLLLLCESPPAVKDLDKETYKRDRTFFIVTGVFAGFLLVYVLIWTILIGVVEAIKKVKKAKLGEKKTVIHRGQVKVKSE